jgi:hypothetical protein
MINREEFIKYLIHLEASNRRADEKEDEADFAGYFKRQIIRKIRNEVEFGKFARPVIISTPGLVTFASTEEAPNA